MATSAPLAVEQRHGLTATEYGLVVEALGRAPNEVELGMFGAMWSEHCAYKHSRPLLGRLPSTGERVLVGPGENAGVIDIGDGLAVVFKVESHNHPSAVEPYQGAATGVGGIIRDIFTMGARPIALLNSLRFGPLDPDHETDAAAAARNRYLFGGVVGGIAGYGNCIGIPDVGGEIAFDASYSGNPLVNAMCVGIARHDEITLARAAGAGSVLMLVGATTGRDGIQGASFASATLGDDREERRPAVQVGNPFLEKLLMEACLELAGLDGVVAMQDLGAAGLTCALAELTARGAVGADVDLDAVPRREANMTAYEVLLSESQERMLIVVRPDSVDEVRAVFARYDLQAARIGTITDDPMIRCRISGALACEVPGRALADEAPRYAIAGGAPARGRAGRARRARGGAAERRHAARAARIGQRPRSQADLAQIRPHERHEHARRPGCRRRRAAADQGHVPRPGGGDRRSGPGARRRARSLPGRRVGRGRGSAQRRLLGRHTDRRHGLPELRVTRDRARRVAARARDRRHRGRLPRTGASRRVGQREPLQRDAGRADPADAGDRDHRHARRPRGPRGRWAGLAATRSGSSAIPRPMSPPSWRPSWRGAVPFAAASPSLDVAAAAGVVRAAAGAGP